MNKSTAILMLSLFLGCSCLLFQGCKLESSTELPFSVKSDLFDSLQVADLGLKTPNGIETFSVFKPSDSTDHFSNGAVMTAFNGYLYCQWQSSKQDEDSEDTWVAYSRSKDGRSWSKPMVLAETQPKGYSTSGGWWRNGDTLVAYFNVWPSKLVPEGGFAYYKTSVDGMHWSDKKPVLMKDGSPMQGVFEQDPRSLENGRIVNAAHFQPGLHVAPIFTDDPSGIRGWTRADFSNSSSKNEVSREIEPSCFSQNDQTLVMVFRDQFSSFFSMASVSHDLGETWTSPMLTEMPDSRSKQSAGNLPDGTVYLVNNPVHSKTRMPLAITLSEDGKFFDRSFVLRTGGEGIQPLRYQGKYKRLGYHYPKSMVHDGYLYVSYTTNKEDVEFTRIPLDSLKD
ncbi:sialidase family protein [Mangrovimonas sp. YM274]|uniref:sialidase family protein n=1 Tax=Mangrovimonas sp. YM274 TaxID=3070660 RepID=UPI0027DC55D4|nr:sialidase family protein [Mangrovimonas sp. YM274]WMI69082.1 sialidase family protein [Mangrovimonas sp. YM274]